MKLYPESERQAERRNWALSIAVGCVAFFLLAGAALGLVVLSESRTLSLQNHTLAVTLKQDVKTIIQNQEQTIMLQAQALANDTRSLAQRRAALLDLRALLAYDVALCRLTPHCHQLGLAGR